MKTSMGNGAPESASTRRPSDLPRWTHRLEDGRHVQVRPLLPTDAALERGFIERLSPTARRMRFLGQFSAPSEALVRQLTEIDPTHDAAFVALAHEDGEKRAVGIARYALEPDGRTAECAVTVDEGWRGRGLATLLMEHLVDVARKRGVATLESIDLADNVAMRELARDLGFERRVDPGDATQVVHRLKLQG